MLGLIGKDGCIGHQQSRNCSAEHQPYAGEFARCQEEFGIRNRRSRMYCAARTVEHMLAAIEARRAAIEAGIERAARQRLLPPGGARLAPSAACLVVALRRKPYQT